jgi:hypothetical protein
VLVAVAVLVKRAVVPALRAGRWSVLRPLLPAAVIGALEAVALVALVLVAQSDATATTTMVALGVGCVAGLLAFLVSSGVGPAVAIRRLSPGSSVLRLPTLLSAALSACLAGLTATGAAAVLVAGDASLVGSLAPVVTVVAVGVVASCTGLVSSARGVRALRGRA